MLEMRNAIEHKQAATQGQGCWWGRTAVQIGWSEKASQRK